MWLPSQPNTRPLQGRPILTSHPKGGPEARGKARKVRPLRPQSPSPSEEFREARIPLYWREHTPRKKGTVYTPPATSYKGAAGGGGSLLAVPRPPQLPPATQTSPLTYGGGPPAPSPCPTAPHLQGAQLHGGARHSTGHGPAAFPWLRYLAGTGRRWGRLEGHPVGVL